MNTFFTELAEKMEDRQEAVLNIKKIEGDLVIMVTPSLKKKGRIIQLKGSAQEIDQHFITEFTKQEAPKTEFASTVTESEEEEEEDEKPSKKPNKPAAKKADEKKDKTNKKAGKKDTPAKEKEMKVAEPTPEETQEAENKKMLEQYVKDGDQYIKERKYPQAEEAFKKAHEIEPDNKIVKEKYEIAASWVRRIAEL